MRINLADGSTDEFDLADAGADERWTSFGSDPDNQKLIRGAILDGHGVEVAVPSPRKFRQVAYSIEQCEKDGSVVGEKISVYADDVTLEVVVYKGRPSIRVGMTKSGRPCFLSRYRQRS